MRDRRTYGLQLQIIDPKTYKLEWFTPRNLKVALAMIEGHVHASDGYRLYKIFDFGNAAWEPIILDTDTVEEGQAADIIGAALQAHYHRP